MNKNPKSDKEMSKWFLRRLIYIGQILSVIAVFVILSAQSQTEKLIAGSLVVLGIILFAYGKKQE